MRRVRQFIGGYSVRSRGRKAGETISSTPSYLTTDGGVDRLLQDDNTSLLEA